MPPPPSSTLFPYTTLFRSPNTATARPPSNTKKFSTVEGLVNVATSTPRSSSTRSCGSTLAGRSEEHTSELQSQFHLVCRLLLDKKNVGVERVALAVTVGAA